MVNNLPEAFVYFIEQKEFPEFQAYTRHHLITLRAIHMCIDNDAAECLELLLSHYDEELEKKVVRGDEWRYLIQRCLLVSSNRCLKVIFKLKDLKLTPIEVELAVYFSDKEVVQDIIRRYYAMDDRLHENIVKACIYKKNIEYIEELMKVTKNCAKESEEWIAQSEVKDYSVNPIYNLNYMKQKKKYTIIPFNKIYQEYNDNNILQYAIERKEERIALLILQTNINLFTSRRTDKATSLILAVKVIYYNIIERTARGNRGDNE